jgi:hypothetical protein
MVTPALIPQWGDVRNVIETGPQGAGSYKFGQAWSTALATYAPSATKACE